MSFIDLDPLSSFPKKMTDRSDHMEIVECTGLSYSDFYKNYLFLNKPCVVKNVSNDWECSKLWVTDRKPNLIYLKEKYGDQKVPVANCGEKYYNAQNKVNMTLEEYVDYWLKLTMDSSENKLCLYLKDWHFQRDFPDDKIYNLPLFFASDWLNEYLLRNPNYEDDYRFVYIGPQGSWTPFHADVFSSFSWSVNICGRKKWVFYEPGQEKHLCNRFGKLTYSVDSEELRDQALFPHQEGLREPLVLIQDAGDAVFVPSGWHHQVWNLADTISINHNWVNACNIKLMWDDMKSKLREVEVEIRDCKDMDGWADHCQLLLRSVYGMDIPEFLNFIFYTADVRIEALKNNKPLATNLSDYLFGENHILYDLISLKSLLKDISIVDLECTLGYKSKIRKLIELIETYY